MKAAALVLIMLITFWITNTLQISCTTYMGCRDIQFGLALSLFFGTIVAVPVIAYLFSADYLARRLRGAWVPGTYLILVVVGCGLYAVTANVVKARPYPETIGQWLHFTVGMLPFLAMAAILFVRQIAEMLDRMSARAD